MGPMEEMLRAAQGRVRFHMPGHKGRLGAVDSALDMTELDATDELYAPHSGIARAERLLARAADAQASILVPGGATAGLLALILAFVPPGGRLLFSRSAHHAVWSACALAGVRAIALPPDEDVGARATSAVCDAVVITRPDYFGAVPSLPRADVPVLVDAAHGAHFNWWDEPASAMRAGADACVESAHKTLGALTPGAWVHLRSRQDAPRVRRMLRMVLTSSPSFLLMKSMDDARAWMDEHGRAALCRLRDRCARARERIDRLGLACASLGDPTRRYVRTDSIGLRGWEAQAQLARLGVDVEMADARGVVAICTVFDREEDFSRLVGALGQLRPGSQKGDFPPPAWGEPALSVRQAALSKTRRVPLEAAAGEVAAVCVGAYPPGCALVAPGERFTPACVRVLLASRLAGARLFGLEDGCVDVVDKGVNADV